MKFNRVNNVVGWIVGLIACTVFVMTMEATGSFWDCGEFVSSCYKLQIPHPPGAPLFILLGRFFIILFGDNPHTAARGVNFMSAIGSGLSILFLFWSITHFARRIVQKGNASAEPDRRQVFTIMAAGVVGALAYTFCDSFWYSAVEGEVYASSAFFTALVFWAILKWEEQADKPGADKWIIFIFYMMGLSVGVHLLNLLTIPAIVMVYYFKRYKPTLWGTILAFGVGCIVTGSVLKFVIQYTIKGAGAFDIYFVNSLNLPFFTGFGFFFVLLAAILVLVLRWAVRKKYYYLKMAVWCVGFMLLGYSTYFTTMIRSNADPAVDMYNVDNPVSLEGYLSRDQYGDWPILYGPDYIDPPPTTEGSDIFVKGATEYEKAGKSVEQDWGNTPSAHLFPRLWNSSNERQEVNTYKKFGHIEEGDEPKAINNLEYFWNYQTNWMFLRYFLWSYAGKQNDLEGFGNVRDGNWISGIPFLDNYRLGDQSKMPDSIHTNNKSYNRLFMLPLILGFIGLVFQYMRHRNDFWIVMLLFFFTGWAIVIYLNQAGLQPRERDYAYAGACYAFAIWIGLGVIWVQEFLTTYAFKGKPDVANYVAAGLCFLGVPVLMCNQEWNDHDRSKKTLARDLAKDYLESCPPNAILFSFGDNDTYPLWYAQEVEGIRPDVRVVVNTLLGTDWYMNELRYKVNESAPFDVIFTPEQIMGDRRNVAYFDDKMPGFDANKYYDLHDILKDVVASDDPKYTRQTEAGQEINIVPTHKFSVPVDLNTVRKNGMAHPGDSVVSELHLELPAEKKFLLKNDLALLAVIATSKWQRPVCFTSPQELNDLGLTKYVRLRGLSYELVPVENPSNHDADAVDNDVAYKTIMEKFAYGNAGTPGVYYDEENRRHLNTIKFAHAQLAESLVAAGKKDSARKVLEHFDQNVLQSNFPYGMTSNQSNLHDYFSFRFLEACYTSEDWSLANKVATSLKKDLDQQMRYYKSLGDNMTDEQLAINSQMLLQNKGGNLSERQMEFARDILSSYQMLMQLGEWQKQYSRGAPPAPRVAPLK
ncbi:MAG TPA: DUF2723 domain-containing protein [Puia sp.]|jgi:hypothetical protein|nr:DUF2723 domain-containing protein [Puia sp.]